MDDRAIVITAAGLRKLRKKPADKEMPELASWVQAQLQNLTQLLKADTPKAKAEFRWLNLQLTFCPVEAKPRPHYEVKGQCDLSALASFYLRTPAIKGAGLDRTLEHQFHNRTAVLLAFR